ncbi:hypothetical protein T11_17770 [Trichinella zimbabwensis]|uniref:Uncharacterized protein n=1 Tax=Trichinella zimbabwensis TaxID=268475 RepID=A0A0V1GT90_9BILA|nr:hypothetical protein T11_17770 [Trichinella zimbabwensis]
MKMHVYHFVAKCGSRFTQDRARHVNQANVRPAIDNAAIPPHQRDLHALPRPVVATLIKRTLAPL